MSVDPSTEIHVNHIAPMHEPAIRDIPLCRLVLAPKNVRKTPANEFAEAELKASIAAHGLPENLVARADEPAEDGVSVERPLPVSKREIGSEDDRAVFVAFRHDLEGNYLP